MTDKALFYILTPEGAVPPDVFVLADVHPKTIMEGCLPVVHQQSGRLLTVHRTRLIPINDAAIATLIHKHSVCIKCGKVEGVVQDKVVCPHNGGADCGLLEAKP